MRSKETQEIDGVQYYTVVCDVTSESHPAYTGQKRFVDTAGRVEKFEKKFAARKRPQKTAVTKKKTAKSK